MGNFDIVGYVGDGFIICRDCAEKEALHDACEKVWEAGTSARIAWWRGMAARMLRWHRKQLLTQPDEAWQAYRVYLAVKGNYRDEDTGYNYLDTLRANIDRHIDEDGSLPWQVLKLELDEARKLLAFPDYVDEEPEVDESKYQPYSEYEASTQLGEQAYEATHYSGPRHGDWRVNFDSCDVCCQPLLDWSEINEAQAEVDGTHWKHDRLALLERLQAGWHEEQLAAMRAWHDGETLDTAKHVLRCGQFERVVKMTQQSIEDAPSWW